MRPLLAALSLLLTLALGLVLGLQLGGRRGTSGSRVPPPAGPAGVQGRSSGTQDRAPPGATPEVRVQVLADVVDGEGHAVPGVLVLAVAIDEHGLPIAPGHRLEAAGELGVLRGKLPYPAEVLAGQIAADPRGGTSGTSDLKGTVRLSGLSPGRLQLLASHEGLSATAEVIVPAASQAEPPHVVLRLQPAPASLSPPDISGEPDVGEEAQAGTRQPVSGVVLDDRTFPLGGVRIEAQVGTLQRSAVSDARGRFTLLGLAPGALVLHVRHPGYAPLSLTLAGATEDGDGLRLHLVPGAGLEGEVRDARLGTVPGRVQLSVTAAGVHETVPVGRDGRFQKTGLPAGEVQVQVQAPGYVPLRRSMQLPAAERPGGVSLHGLRLELELGGTLAGRIQDSSGPARGVKVKVLDEAGTEVGQATSDDRGEFRLTRLPAGRLTVTAGTASTPVEVRGGTEAHADLDLR